MHTIRNICCALETLVGTAYLNRLALSNCGEAGVSNGNSGVGSRRNVERGQYPTC